VPLPKKGQEELVGFVLVVVIVAIAGLILMGLFLRIEDGRKETKSADIAQFLDSAFLEGTNVCSVLNISLQDIIKSSWMVSENSVIKGYDFQIVMTMNRTTSSINTPVILIQEGVCANDYRVGEHLQPGTRRGTSLVTALKLCSDT